MLELKIILPVYNEEGAIAEVINDWILILTKLKIKFQIYAINDGSTDNTLSILQSIAKENENIIVVNKHNSGHGPTILKAYKENMDVPWLFQVDSDNEIKAYEFEKFWNRRNEFDFLIGKRIHRNSSIARVVTSLVSRLVVGILYGNKVRDVNAPFRLFRTSEFKDELLSIPSNTFAPNLILTGIANKKNMRIKQLEVSHHSRKTGVVSIEKWTLLKAASTSFFQTVRYRIR